MTRIEALAQPDYRAVKTYHEGKPVYVSQPEQELEYCVDYHCAGDCGQPHNQQEMQAFLVAQPLQRPWGKPWVSLTAEDRWKILYATEQDERITVMQLVEAKLKEKNT